MIFVNLLISVKRKFNRFWEEKIFRIAVLLHLFYYFLSIILFFTVLSEKNDFLIFYKSGKIFLNDINNLYNQTYYLWDFRYFPLSALFFVPFSLIDFRLAFVLFNTLNLFLNFLIIMLLYKIIKRVRGKDHEQNDKRIILYISIYLMGVPHVLNYIYGQINLFITLFILISLIIFLTYKSNVWQFIGSFILGVSIIIKPTSIFLIPFLLILHFDLEKRKLKIDFSKSFIRIFGVILPVLSNFVLFAAFPKLWEDFLETNFTGSNPIALNFSYSLTKLITNFCYLYNIPFSQLTILLVSVGFFGGIGFIIFVSIRRKQNSILYGYTFGILIMLLTYFDSWDHHLLNLTPLLIIIIFNLPRKTELLNYIKPSLFFFNFFDILFVGIWYLTYPLFPYNFVGTFFLILALFGVIKYCLVKNKKSKNVEVGIHEG